MPHKDSDSDVKRTAGSASGRPSYLRGPHSRQKAAGQVQDQEETKAVPSPEETASVKEEPKEDVELYTWKVWLFPRRPLVSAFVVVSVLGSIALAYWTLPQAFFVAIITLILVNRLAPYLFPVKYTLTEQTAGYRTFMARDIRTWERFITYRNFPDGMLLTHDTRTVRGRMKEGLFLYFHKDGSNKDEIVRIVSSKLKPPSEAFVEADLESKKRGGLRAAFDRIRRLKSKE